MTHEYICQEIWECMWIFKYPLHTDAKPVGLLNRGSACEMDGQTKCHRIGKRVCLWNG